MSNASARAIGKAFEREAARFFGTVRFLPQARNADKHSADFATDTIVGECKYRTGEPSPQEIEKWLDGVCQRAARDGKAGVLCIRRRGQRGGFWIVERDLDGQPMMRFTGWLKTK